MANIAVLLAVMAMMVGGSGATVLHSGAAARLDRASCLRLRGGGNVLSKLQEFREKLPLVQRSGPKIIISGAPASGKGTQCELIVEKFGVVHISTGDVLRAEVKAGTDLGHRASDYMNKGALVPDELIIDIVKSRLSDPDCTRKGWLLDGFPRTGVQAEAMRKAGIIADQFILLNVPDETLIERVLGRRTDPKTGKIYHLKFNPPPDDKAIQKRLVHRTDDNLEAIQARIAQYKANVNAVRGYFRGITSEIDGVGDKRVIAEKITQIIKESVQAL